MANTKPRDSQKQRLYDAQRLAGFYDTGELMTIKEAQKFVNQVLSHQRTKKMLEKLLTKHLASEMFNSEKRRTHNE